jgi:phosphate transport system substrate-binding protein
VTKLGRRSVRSAAIAAVLVVGLAACGNDDDGGSSAPQLSGSIAVDGSSTVGPLTSVAADLFKEDNPNVNVTVGISGTGGGFEKFCNGETDISDASRPIKDEEIAACEGKGITYGELHIATDALTVVVNKENTWAQCLTVDQLKKMWEPAAEGEITNWNQIDPSFPDEKLELFGPGTDSGTFDYFTGEINGEEGASRTDYSPSEDDNVTVQGVAGTKGGLGYFGYSYFEENQDTLAAVQIDGGDGCVAPSAETAQDGSYSPLSRPLFIYPKKESLTRPEVVGFLDFYVTNIDDITSEAQFIPLNAEQKSKLQSDLTTLKSAS